jgi:16S rRNA G966 N2-methylase RsmD
MMSDDKIAREAILEITGPWNRVSSGLNTGPKEWWVSSVGIAIEGSESRVKREFTRWSSSTHQGRPELLAHGGNFVIWGLDIKETIQRPTTPLSIIELWRPEQTQEITGTIKEVLNSLAGDNDSASPEKLLKRCGIKRKIADRLLGLEISIEGHWGDTLGGVGAGWIVCSGDDHISLSWGRSMEGFWEIDRAAVQLETGLNSVEVDGLNDSERMFLLFAALREMNHNGDPELVKTIIAPWLTPKDPDMVYVQINGPEWIDSSEWIPADGMVKAHTARWLLHHIHGVTLTTAKLEVKCTPPIRAGNKPQHREPLDTRRNRLFSRWFEGVKIDDTGLFSATPEALAMELTRGSSGVVFDATCGVGAISIAAARNPNVSRVIAVDTDLNRLEMARHNAKIYGVAERIEFIHGDSNEVIQSHTPDLIIADPPWGGRNWNRDKTNLQSLGMELSTIMMSQCEVILKLPLSFDISCLPGLWTPFAMVDSRGIIKFIKVSRSANVP